MRALLCVIFAAFLTPAFAAQKTNVLFIAIDDLRDDLGSLGVDYARTPNLDSFAATARVFDHHYAQVPTCGASRCALLRGKYPDSPQQIGNNATRDTQSSWNQKSLPAIFRQNGYRTLALGKISHYPGNLTGKNWADGPEELSGAWDRAWIPDCPWKTPLAIMHGYANGVARVPGKSPAWQSFDGPDEAFPDAWIAKEAVATLQQLAKKNEPWFFAVGFFKPHLPFAAPKKYFDLHKNRVPDLKADAAEKPSWPSSWHNSGEFRGNYGHNGRDPATDPAYARQIREAYAASISYMDAQVGRVLKALHDSGLEKNTIVVIWGDHGFLLGEHAIWGKHCVFENALRSPLMIRYPALPQPGKVSSAIVETVDIFPTLADLCRLPAPEKLDGRTLRPYLLDPALPTKKPALGFWVNGQRTIRNDRWRLVQHPGKGNDAASTVELFDYLNDPNEVRNHAAEEPEIARELLAHLEKAPKPGAKKPRSK